MEKAISIEISKLKCDASKRNELEIDFLKRLFAAKQPIPCPCVNKNNEVIAFQSSYFVLKDFNIKEASAILIE